MGSTCQTASQTIRSRRSAVDMDGKSFIDRQAFFSLLAAAMPSLTPVPWNAIAWRPMVHLLLFVHRVGGLVPGLYFLVRDPGRVEFCKSEIQAKFDWAPPEAGPAELPLFLLKRGDVRTLSAQVSCHQDIASDGAFAVSMLAEFEHVLREQGPHRYRRLFWETGMIGQVLYLKAIEAGTGATGIGCFFDDPVHELLQLRSRSLQALYHFTVGQPLDDPRITTLPSYPAPE